jgi:hypothetical protein
MYIIQKYFINNFLKYSKKNIHPKIFYNFNEIKYFLKNIILIEQHLFT